MNESTQQSGRGLLLLWAIASSLLALASTAMLLFFFVRAAPSSPSNLGAGAAPFLASQEDAVAGRYKWTEGNEVHGVITLLPDHSFIPPSGQQARVHQWEIGRDALLVIFASGVQRFTSIESPGVFISAKRDGRIVRMEKEP